MSLKDCQRDVHEWTGQFIPQYWPPFEIMTNLLEEAGELAGEINREYGHKKKYDPDRMKKIEEEMTNLLFPVFCLANSLEIDLQEAWERMMQERQYKRDNQRFERKE